MRLEIKEFEPSTVSLDGSQTLEPSNRLNRSSRRFNRRFASRTTPPEEFSPFPVARWGARPVHLREAMGPPSGVIASRGDVELGGNVEIAAIAASRPRRTRRPGAGARPGPADPGRGHSRPQTCGAGIQWSTATVRSARR
jgi:hypothetical protein